MELTTEILNAASVVTYEWEGLPGEILQPVRWEDGLLAWQLVNADGDLCGFWNADGSADKFDRVGEFSIVKASAAHLEMLASQAGKRTSTTLLVDGRRRGRSH